MTTLTVTSKGQITLRRELLRHLGVKPRERIEIRPLPGGRVEVNAAGPKGSVEPFAFCGLIQTSGRSIANRSCCWRPTLATPPFGCMPSREASTAPPWNF